MKKLAAGLPLVGIFFWSSLVAYDYVYPVGEFRQFDDHFILVMYQKTPDHTELWQLNTATKEAERVLLSNFTPVGVSFLPDNAGFSFFDNGRLRIKHFLKRSSKAIDIYEPIYEMGPLQWTTTDLCLFHAKERERSSLYELNAYDGSVTTIKSKETSDYSYPSQIGSSLFYIEHTSAERLFAGRLSVDQLSAGQWSMLTRLEQSLVEQEVDQILTELSPAKQGLIELSSDMKKKLLVPTELSSAERVVDPSSAEQLALSEQDLTELLPAEQEAEQSPTELYSIMRSSLTEEGVGSEQCLITHDRPLACLSMYTEYEGIVIERPANIDNKVDTTLDCICYHVACVKDTCIGDRDTCSVAECKKIDNVCVDDTCENGKATLTKLFSFSLPLSLLLPSSKARLCESVYPLLPRRVGERIYFVTVVEGVVRPFYFTTTHGVQSLVVDPMPFGDLFIPYVVQAQTEEPMADQLVTEQLATEQSKTEQSLQMLVYGGCLQREDLFENQEPVERLILQKTAIN